MAVGVGVVVRVGVAVGAGGVGVGVGVNVEAGVGVGVDVGVKVGVGVGVGDPGVGVAPGVEVDAATVNETSAERRSIPCTLVQTRTYRSRSLGRLTGTRTAVWVRSPDIHRSDCPAAVPRTRM